MRHRRSSKSKRRRAFEQFVVVDIADNPIARFDTEAAAKEFVSDEAHGRRIVQMNVNGVTTIINNEIRNALNDLKD